jgi:hypothetical protein
MTRTFWILIAFSLACILAGAAVGFFGPRLIPAHSLAPAAAPQLGKPPPAR